MKEYISVTPWAELALFNQIYKEKDFIFENIFLNIKIV